jgi:hypothetical protein
MRLWTELVSPRGWPSLRRVLLAALLLVMVMLEGGASLRQAQAQTAAVRMFVSFSPSTPPIKPEVICKDQDYQIVVRPMLQFESVRRGVVPLLHSIVWSLTQPALGTLNGTTAPIKQYSAGGLAVFTYKAQRTGQEILNLGWTNFLPPNFPGEPSYTDIAAWPNLFQAPTEFTFEVRECTYKVSFVLTIQYAPSGMYMGQFGVMDEASLARRDGGNFEGVGTFEITSTTIMAGCVFDNKDFDTQPRITGELLQDSRTLKLTFNYGNGVWKASGACLGKPVGEKSEPWDITPFAPRTANFPVEGGDKSFQFNYGPGKALLTIIVKLELTQ